MHMRQVDEPLIYRGQPQIMAAAPGTQNYYPYPQAPTMQPQMQPQMPTMPQGPQVPQPIGTQFLFPEHSHPMVQSFDNRYVWKRLRRIYSLQIYCISFT